MIQDDKDFLITLWWAWFIPFFVLMLTTAIAAAPVGGNPAFHDFYADGWGDAITIAVLWPLFAIKYLLLGLWFLVSNGAALLF